MKKLLLMVCAILTVLSIPSKAQNTNDDEKIRVGFKAGLNRSNVWDESGQDFEANPKIGLAGGAFLSIPFNRHLGFQPELMISQKGFQGSGTMLGFPYSFSRTTTYFDVPLQFQLKPTRNLILVAGPQYSYLLKQRDVYNFGDNRNAQEEEFYNDNIRKNTLCFVGGADIISSQVVFSGRVGWDMLRNNGDGTSTTPRYKNQWLQFTIGYQIE
jgi:hypothetical protein